MLPERLAAVLAAHAAYLAGEPSGVRAELHYAHLLEADLRNADLRNADLRNADLQRALLHGANLSGANLTGANLTGANLTRADLTGADLTGADLSRADFTRATLTGAKLPPAPAVANLDGKILKKVESRAGKLEMATWHACRTTHCRAGWAIVLAGKAGKALEAAHGPAAAGTLIYAASYPGRPIPDFYTNNASALGDIRRGAAA